MRIWGGLNEIMNPQYLAGWPTARMAQLWAVIIYNNTLHAPSMTNALLKQKQQLKGLSVTETLHQKWLKIILTHYVIKLYTVAHRCQQTRLALVLSHWKSHIRKHWKYVGGGRGVPWKGNQETGTEAPDPPAQPWESHADSGDLVGKARRMDEEQQKSKPSIS